MMSMMLREIGQQPVALARTLKAERSHMLHLASSLIIRNIHLIILVARGTSDNAALFGRYLLEIKTGIPVSLSAPSVHTLYRRKLKLSNTLVIGISQSGEGSDINIVLESCKKSGAYVVVITNAKDSTMAGIAHETFITRAGVEKSVAATKTYTCQLMLFYMLAEAISKGDFEQLYRIPDQAHAALKMAPSVEAIIERYRFMDRCAVVGRGVNYASAFELAIKLMETCYVMAERFSSADFLHGPIAVVERDFPVFLFAPPGRVYKDMWGLAKRLKSLKADSLIISSEKSVLQLANAPLKVPVHVPDLYSPIPYIIPGQLVAAKLAELKGLDPDRPRSLSKVTKTI
jgi:glucosamine--fructose-6-phosphate aminotransferase (isomerizing)